MNRNKPLRVVFLTARQPGLWTIHGLLAQNRPAVEPVAIFTHRLEPKMVDPSRPMRPEYPRYTALAEQLGVPLHTVDSRDDARQMPGLEACRPFDVLLSVSWWYMVEPHCLEWADLAALNLHRGKLPEYAGLRPVIRALEAGEQTVTLTAHIMTARCDEGPIITERIHRVGPFRDADLQDRAERVKRQLWPLYAPAAHEAIETCLHGTARADEAASTAIVL